MRSLQIFSGEKCNTNQDKVEQIILLKYNQYYRMAYSYVHDDAAASDIVQNGAYKAIRSSHTLQHPEFAATWVYRIMLNECFQYLRQPRHLSYEELQADSGIMSGSTEDHYADIDLQRAIDALPEHEKAIVILKYFEDQTLEQIADILDENINTVKSRLYRCMKKLRLALSEEKNL